jgi:excinuclease UvrABC helicase subunit UvrB
MRKTAKNLKFEKAALLRYRIIELRKDEEILSPLTRFK